MPLETKDVLKALGIPEDVDSVEKVVEAHGKSFIPLAEAHTDDRVVEKITGKIYGSLNTEAKRLFDFKNEDIKDKKFEDILKAGVDKFTTKIKELSNNTGDEKITAITKERDTFKNQAEQFKGDLDKVVTEKTELETQFNGKIKQFKVESILKEAKSKLPFSEGIPPVAKIGFDTQLKEKYKFDLDDEGNAVVQTADGKRIKNPAKSGTYLTLDEVLDMELDAAGLKKKNNLDPKNKFQFQPSKENNNGDKPVKSANPKAVAFAERLAASKR